MLTARRLRFSDFAYTCLFVFFVLHAIGAHYTYSLVPYADWWQSLAASPLEGRNHYDRLVHFLYGLLVAPAAVELFAHYGRYCAALGLSCFRGCSWRRTRSSTRLIEFAAAVVFGGDLGQAYLGTQGDIWDGQKDMALALAGTTIMLAALAAAADDLRRVLSQAAVTGTETAPDGRSAGARAPWRRRGARIRARRSSRAAGSARDPASRPRGLGSCSWSTSMAR